mgnify:CR=1 FL=1
MKNLRDYSPMVDDEPCPHCGGAVEDGQCTECASEISEAPRGVRRRRAHKDDDDCAEFMASNEGERIARGFMAAHSDER